MDRDQVLATLKAHEPELRRRGVRHAALFGSLARNEAGPDSDIDVLIDLEPDARVGVWEFIGIGHYLSDLFLTKVDVVERQALKPLVAPNAEHDAIHVF